MLDMEAELNPQDVPPKTNFIGDFAPWDQLPKAGDYGLFAIVNDNRLQAIMNYPYAATAYPVFKSVVSTVPIRGVSSGYSVQPNEVFMINNTGQQDTQGHSLYSIVNKPVDGHSIRSYGMFNSSNVLINETTQTYYLQNTSVKVGIPISQYQWSINNVRSLTLSMPIRSVYGMTMTTLTPTNNGGGGPNNNALLNGAGFNTTTFAIYSSMASNRRVVIQPANWYGWFVGLAGYVGWDLSHGGIYAVMVRNTTTSNSDVLWALVPIRQMFINASNGSQILCQCKGPDCGKCASVANGTGYVLKYKLCPACNLTAALDNVNS